VGPAPKGVRAHGFHWDVAPQEHRIARGYHVLLEIDASTRQGVCAVCGPTRIRVKRSTLGWRCCNAEKRWDGRADREKVGDRCERCGFEPEDVCQLDVHHVNGGRKGPVQTLCANCHRLVTKRERHGRLAV